MPANTRVVSSRLTRPRPLPTLRPTGSTLDVSRDEKDSGPIPPEPIPPHILGSASNNDAITDSKERLAQADLVPEESSTSIRDLPSVNTNTQVEEPSILPIGDKVESPPSEPDGEKIAAFYETLRRRTNGIPKERIATKGNDTLYFERRGYFARKHRSQLKKRSQDELGSFGAKYQDAGVAFSVQKQFHNFALIVQGYLSGLSLGKAVFAIYFANEQILQESYQHISLPVHVAFVVAFSIASVAAYDRLGIYDFTLMGVANTVSHSGFLGAVLWTACLVCSLLCMRFDEQLSKGKGFTSPDLLFWRTCCVVRAVAAGAAWLLLALKPEGDELADAIHRSIEQEIESEKALKAESRRRSASQHEGEAADVQEPHPN